MCSGFVRSHQPEHVPAHLPKQKASKVAALPLRKSDSSRQQSGGSLAAQFRKRAHDLEKDWWKTGVQFKKLDRHYQHSDDQKPNNTPRTPRRQQQLSLRERMSNRTRDDFIFAKLLQRCSGRTPGGGQNNNHPQAKCPQGTHWPRGELWKAWCMQSKSCIPRAVCHKLIKRIGKTSSSDSWITHPFTNSPIYM